MIFLLPRRTRVAKKTKEAEPVAPVVVAPPAVAMGEQVAVATKTVIRPINDQVVVRRSTIQEKRASGLVIPERAQDKPREGVVLSVGEGLMLNCGTRATPQVKKDDKVIFASYSGTEVKLDGDTEVLIIKENDIHAIIEEA
jgi:chaperonin GroES